MRAVAAIFLFLVWMDGAAQNYRAFQKTLKELYTFSSKDSVAVQSAVDTWWSARLKKGQVPLVGGDSVAFLYRGTATSIAWNGDFNFWGSKPFNNQGRRVANTNVWVLKCSFPSRARLDYKIVVNSKEWIVDPNNPNQQYTGVGGGTPNSELRMPAWRKDPAQDNRSVAKRGKTTVGRIESRNLGYALSYTLYEPAEVAGTQSLPILYVTDGSEYLDPRLGNMTQVVDRLIADGRIRPLRVVYVDARDPDNPTLNRRMSELSLNDNYLKFVAEELVPAVEGSKPVLPSARGILGTSLGGLNSAFFAFKRPDLFGVVAIQSPAFWYKPEIFHLAEQTSATKLNVFISSGLFYDGADEAKRMKALLDKSGHRCTYLETPEGHSWGQWRNLLDDLLIVLYPKP
jgi:enterochelin esterase family protein